MARGFGGVWMGEVTVGWLFHSTPPSPFHLRQPDYGGQAWLWGTSRVTRARVMYLRPWGCSATLSGWELFILRIPRAYALGYIPAPLRGGIWGIGLYDDWICMSSAVPLGLGFFFDGLSGSACRARVMLSPPGMNGVLVWSWRRYY